MFDEKSGFGTLEGQTLRFSLLLQALRNSDGHGDGGADHRVVAHAQGAHYLHVRVHGGGTGKLGVGMHAAHGICHTVGGGTGSHVVRVQGTACLLYTSRCV